MEEKINLLDPKEIEKLDKKPRSPKEFSIQRLSLKFDKSLKSDYVVDSEEKAIYLVNDYLSDSPNEVLMAIGLDSERHPIGSCIVGIGNAGHVDSNYNNLFKYVFNSGADSFFLVHNHPSQRLLKPSEADIESFEQLGRISDKLGVRFRDFIITGNYNQNRAYYSWSRKGVITQYDFLKTIKQSDLKKTVEVTDTAERTLEEVDNLLAESKYNSEDSLTIAQEKSSKGLFGMFK